MIPEINELSAAIGVVAGSVAMGIVATAAGDVAPVDVILREWGPVGMAVFVLYRRVDKLEDRIDQNTRNIDDLD